MADRRKIAPVLLVLGAGLAVVAGFRTTYSTVYRGYGPEVTISSTLWTTTSDPSDGPAAQPAQYAAGWPVVISALVVVAAVVLMTRERTAVAGRPLAVGGAGALAGVVFSYLSQVWRLEDLVQQLPPDSGLTYELNYLSGMHLLVAAAIIALAGAALAQRGPQSVQPREEVVVHQLGADDDTPPFGIAIPDEREAR
ncbi:hypothetical protein SAMN05216188_11110 [Lentzea xinjiangensis]|uniref:Tryptophan-associated transmembrane protein (Trp_oprn_chp) n=1 Tax=Lentzea xinjiangensis TaxID=402600 RepID=A0A1H9NV71_9PSEU|nr:hypothetical protein [Lentzea xinjiangensis]SER39822.1 hypothetical protein SAMN05216188_11110 [Lentzea xinjiangensis]